jgi:hypothetical protein
MGTSRNQNTRLKTASALLNARFVGYPLAPSTNPLHLHQFQFQFQDSQSLQSFVEVAAELANQKMHSALVAGIDSQKSTPQDFKRD